MGWQILRHHHGAVDAAGRLKGREDCRGPEPAAHAEPRVQGHSVSHGQAQRDRFPCGTTRLLCLCVCVQLFFFSLPSLYLTAAGPKHEQV